VADIATNRLGKHLAKCDDDCMFDKLRGVDRWPSTEATVTSTEVVSTGGRSGRTMNVYFDYKTDSSSEEGKFFVDDNSSLYGLAPGERFSLQFNPKRPSNYYSSEAKSLSQTIRRSIVFVGMAFAIFVFVVEFFGNSRR
jgi:hypothetical protein